MMDNIPLPPFQGGIERGHPLTPFQGGMLEVSMSESIRLETDGLGKDTKIDREARMIKGFQVMRAGPAKGHGFDIDDTTLDQLVDAGKRLDKGARGHLGHSSFLGPDSLTTYLGRARNFRRDGDTVRADFQFAQAADSMPGALGGATAIMNLAEEDPDAFGASVVILGWREEEEDGRKLRIGSLHAVDWVGEPAATSGVFSEGSSSSHNPSKGELTRALEWCKRLLGREVQEPEGGEWPQNAGEGLPAQQELTMATAQTMDLSALSVDQIRQQRPDLVAALREEVKGEVRPEVLDEARKAEREQLKKHIETIKEYGNAERFEECLTALAEEEDEASLIKRMLRAEKEAREEQLAAKREQTDKTKVAPAAMPSEELTDVDALVQAELAEMKKYDETADEVEAFSRVCAKYPSLDDQLNGAKSRK